MPHPEMPEPQGRTIRNHMKFLQVAGIEEVRVGKFIRMELEAETEVDAYQKVEKICQKLLANPVTESYHFHLHEAPVPTANTEEMPEETFPPPVVSEEE
jgi:phosphoribosylformylglycinamidine synthase